MNKIIQWITAVVAIIALVLSVSTLVGGNQSAAELGASGTRFPNGLSADTTSPTAGLLRGTNLTITNDATVSGGTLNVTTSNTATSTAKVGCIQTTATSTATQWKLVLVASSTQMADGYQGILYAQYGTCPNL